MKELAASAMGEGAAGVMVAPPAQIRSSTRIRPDLAKIAAPPRGERTGPRLPKYAVSQVAGFIKGKSAIHWPGPMESANAISSGSTFGARDFL